MTQYDCTEVMSIARWLCPGFSRATLLVRAFIARCMWRIRPLAVTTNHHQRILSIGGPVNTGSAFWLIITVGGAVLLGVALTYGLISRRGRRPEEPDPAKEEEPDAKDRS
jgi:hypothetical protein